MADSQGSHDVPSLRSLRALDPPRPRILAKSLETQLPSSQGPRTLPSPHWGMLLPDPRTLPSPHLGELPSPQSLKETSLSKRLTDNLKNLQIPHLRSLARPLQQFHHHHLLAPVFASNTGTSSINGDFHNVVSSQPGDAGSHKEEGVHAYRSPEGNSTAGCPTSGMLYYSKLWDPHPFDLAPPFVLGNNGASGYFCPRLQLDVNHSLSRILGVGVFALEDAYFRIARVSQSERPDIQGFSSWFRLLQRQFLGENVSLLDIWIYSDLNRPGIESFRRKVWALASMIDLPIIISTFGVKSVYLRMVYPNYESLDIRLRISTGPNLETLVPLPDDLQQDSTFETWLEVVDVPIPPSFIFTQ